MSREKQIEEIARFMLEKSNSANVEPIFMAEDGTEIVLDEKSIKLLDVILEQAFIPFLAETLYNEGYCKQEWVSVDERLPDNDWGKHWKDRNYYLVFTKPSGLMNVAVYGYKEHNWWVDRNSCVLDKKNYKEVTHWMPLTEPPRKEDEGK